ncbi:peptide chain release factor N(5)-glutamine methyltransferase [bacterium]|nr:peptide chain release factor N(5)-glutamine methyltransferase [bacterium]
MKTELRYLLKDKYNWDEVSIQKYFEDPNQNVDPSILRDTKRLRNGEPLAYIIGWVEFLGSKIEVNKNVLIPRVETEFWVQKVINNCKSKNQKISVLDLCCGSGCIGISILNRLPKSFVTFADISPKALEQTKENLISCNISNSRYKIIESNLFESLKDIYDLILTNPPYVSTKNTNPDLKFEPSKALYAGLQGLDLIKKILSAFPKFLKLGGEIYIEISEDQKDELQKLLTGKYNNFEFIKDQNGLCRVLHLVV